MSGETSSAREPRSLAALVEAVVHQIEEVMPPGDVAALRRLDPHDPAGAAFWRLLAAKLWEELPDGGPARDERERRWAVIAQAAATLKGLHASRHRLGAALAESDFSEMRFLQLLRARGDMLADQIRLVGHFLASQGVRSDVVDLARLVLSDGRDDGEAVRRSMARDYFGALRVREKQEAKA